MVPFSKIPESVIDSPEHRDLALKCARESMVLLTNKNNFLPLDKSKLKTVAVIGPASLARSMEITTSTPRTRRRSTRWRD